MVVYRIKNVLPINDILKTPSFNDTNNYTNMKKTKMTKKTKLD